MTRASPSGLAAALQAAEEGSSTGGGWPEHLPVELQDAWTVMVEVEAVLVGAGRARLAGGGVDRAQLREAVDLLREPVLQRWSTQEVDRWRRVAELLSTR